MKSILKLLWIVGVVLICLLPSCAEKTEKVKELTFTTTSAEALDLFNKGVILHENFETSKAAELFEKAIELDPDFALAYLQRAYCRTGYDDYKSNYNKAMELYDQVSRSEQLLLDHAKAIHERNNELRVASLDSLLAIYPNNKRINGYAGTYNYWVVQDYDKALKYFQTALEADSMWAPAWNMTGYAYSEQGKFEEAQKAFEKYISLIPDIGAGYDSYGELLLKMGKFDESIAQYKKAYELNPDMHSALLGLGNNHTFLNDHEKARKYFKTYFENQPSISQKMYAKLLEAASYLYENNLDAALVSIDERKQLALDEGRINEAIRSAQFKGWVLSESGKCEESVACNMENQEFISSSELEGNELEIEKLFCNMCLYYCYTAAEKFDKADEVAEEINIALQHVDDNWTTKFYETFVGINEYKKGNFAQSIEHFDKGILDNALFNYYRAQAYKEAGDTENSDKLVKDIKESTENDIALALALAKL